MESSTTAAMAGPVVDWAVQNSGAFVSGTVSVVIILVLAVLARVLVGRVITHLLKRMVDSHARISGGLRTVVTKSAAPGGTRQQARAETIGSVLRSLASFTIFGVALLMVLGEFGISLGPILASAGVLGLAIGFGAQGLVQDFLSGMFMMAEDQYGVGDVVDVGDAVGTVEEVGLRITKIRDLDGGLWYVRNGEIRRVCNMNQGWANAVVDLPLSHTVDVAHAEQAIERNVAEFADSGEYEDKLLDRPEVAGVVSIGNGAVTVRVIAKTRPGEQWTIGRVLRSHLKQGLDQEGIEVAYPIPQIAQA